ncbi:amidohydrolase [Marinisporobacter balticus]|uniref:Aminobenzoyl-glutamate utilization protein A n=1 Tax=Marinisporobacter balticus TaxID=2018667 RepID=A0A4R2KJF9_9FIRM|nr:amidohydrolase [Marinisporobacter balticus]TCO70739.1 aminobenzoyl-glutamate utilization protein A [Marinisporobacter balticus]
MDEKLEEKLIAYRRDFHKYAETGWTEFRTSSKIAEVLSTLGYEVLLGKEMIEPSAVMGRMKDEEIKKHIDRAISQGANPKWIDRMDGYTGVVAILDTKIDGPTTALRFDIDANDAVEIEDHKHRPYKECFASQNEGAMHACGHDGHAAIGLGLAHELIKNKEQLTGKIKLIFQPAEEGVRGANAIVEKGLLDDVDYFLSGHIGLGITVGKIIAKPWGFLCTTKMDVTYTGKGAHAGTAPNEGNNALLAASSAVLNLYAIPPHKDGPTRINVGILQAGVGRNVIAPSALMKLETRGLNHTLNQYMYDKAVKIIENTARMYDVSYKIEKMGQAVDCTCDEELVDLVIKQAKDVMGVVEIEREIYFGGSEDVTLMIKRVQDMGGKSVYILLGTEIAAQHHNEWFDFDERILKIAVNLFENLIQFLNHQK